MLVTSYEQLRIQRELLIGIRWGYAILDEGHKIRNPDADVTLVAKQLQTVSSNPQSSDAPWPLKEGLYYMHSFRLGCTWNLHSPTF